MSAPIPTDWATIEQALYDWFSDAIAPTPAAWGNQDFPQLVYPFGTLTIISGPTMVGGSDEINYTFDALAPPGEEINQNIYGLRKFTLSLHLFDKPPNSLIPTLHPRALMSAVQTSLAFPSVHAAFNAANIALIRKGDAVMLDGYIEDTWIAHAGLDLEFACVSMGVETTGYISTARLTGTPTELEGDYDLGV